MVLFHMLFLIISSIIVRISFALTIGSVNNTRFTSFDQINTDAIWIRNQSTANKCLCTVLAHYRDVILFNSFTNGSCQLFSALPFTYRLLSHSTSTLILLRSLPARSEAPCCSNLTWLMNRIISSALPVTLLTSPTYLAIDDLDYLGVISYNDKMYRFNRTLMTQVTSKVIASTCMSLTYYKGNYFVGCGSGITSRLYVLSATNLNSITNISVPSDPRDVIFIRNDTVMIASVAGTSRLAFYNVTSPTTYTLTSTLQAPNTPYNMYRVNDTLIYVATMTASTALYTLTGLSNGSWIWNSLPATRSDTSSSNFHTIFDSCGRMWISVKGYGIRIFDSTGTTSLYNWSLSTGLNDIALSETFDFYAADFLGNKIHSYRPNIPQCTA